MNRVRIVKFFILISALLLLAYIFIFQISRGKKYYAMAKKIHQERVELIARRGDIYDRYGRIVATDIPSYRIYVIPRYLNSKEKFAFILDSLRIMPYDKVMGMLNSRKSFFYIKDGVPPVKAYILKTLLKRERFLNAVGLIKNYKRIYPYADTIASVVGFVGDGRGLAGVESRHNDIIGGKSGWALYVRSPSGDIYPLPEYPVSMPEDGEDVYLTIDLDIQRIVYSELKKGVEEFDAKFGSAVVLDAKTGEVLAMVDYPDYNPEMFYMYPKERWQIGAISYEFEPGSSFKHIVASGILENHLMGVHDKINTSGGVITISGKRIKDVHPHGYLTFPEVIIYSSNVGAVRLGLKLGKEKFLTMVRNMGFGKKTGIDLPGEGEGFVPEYDKISLLRFANMTFGQGLRVTLLQLTASYAVIANEGRYTLPLIIKKIVKKRKVKYRARTLLVNHSLSKRTALIMKEILREVVLKGTGRNAEVEGLEICGKTGTAQKAVEGGYSDKHLIHTFVGFFPKRDPVFVIGVMLNEPLPYLYAAQTSAVIFGNIAKRIIKIRKEYKEEILVYKRIDS